MLFKMPHADHLVEQTIEQHWPQPQDVTHSDIRHGEYTDGCSRQLLKTTAKEARLQLLQNSGQALIGVADDTGQHFESF